MKDGDKVKITITITATLGTDHPNITADQLTTMLFDEPIVDTSLIVSTILEEGDNYETMLEFESIAIAVKKVRAVKESLTAEKSA